MLEKLTQSTLQSVASFKTKQRATLSIFCPHNIYHPPPATGGPGEIEREREREREGERTRRGREREREWWW